MNANIGIAILFYVILIWQLFWKGVALWRASKNNQTYWFIAFIILFPFNEVGIIEIIYLFWFAKKRLTLDEMRGWIDLVANMRSKQTTKK